MCFNAPASLAAWLIITGLSTWIWCRNAHPFDPALASFFIAVGLIQLAELLFYLNQRQPSVNVGRWIYVILWLQVTVLGLGAYSTMALDRGPWDAITVAAGVWAVIITVVSAWAVMSAGQSSFQVLCGPGTEAAASPQKHMVWQRNGGPILGSRTAWAYMLGLLLPIVLLTIAYSTVGLAVILIYGFLSFIFCYALFRATLPSMWCFTAVGLVVFYAIFQGFG